jgi:NTP pyrophosphatase (non-canonical NTP hydrolase)
MFERHAVFEVIRKSRELEPYVQKDGWTISDGLAKLNEETGEFAEATLIKTGKITNKGPFKYGSDFEEAADSIICIVDTITRLNPDLDPMFVYTELLAAIDKKSQKWVNKVKGE